MNPHPFTRRSILPLLLLAAASLVVGCQGPGALDNPEPLVVTAAENDPLPTPKDTPTPTQAPTETAAPSPTAAPTPSSSPESSSGEVPPTGSRAGASAPDLTLPNLEGADVSLRDMRGKPVLLNFWASW